MVILGFLRLSKMTGTVVSQRTGAPPRARPRRLTDKPPCMETPRWYEGISQSQNLCSPDRFWSAMLAMNRWSVGPRSRPPTTRISGSKSSKLRFLCWRPTVSFLTLRARIHPPAVRPTVPKSAGTRFHPVLRRSRDETMVPFERRPTVPPQDHGSRRVVRHPCSYGQSVSLNLRSSRGSRQS